MISVACVGFAFAAVIWVVVRDSPEQYRKYFVPNPKKHRGKLGRTEWENLKAVCKKTQTWWLALFSCCTWAPTLVFAGLWGIPYLVANYNVSATQASGTISVLWIAIAIGSPLVGFISDKIHRRLLLFNVCSAIGLIASTILLISPMHSWFTISVLLFLFGLGASAQALSFALVKDTSNSKLVGTAIGFNNMAIVSGGALLQPFVGIVLQAQWHGELLNGSPIYQASSYREAFILLPICYLIALLVSVFKLKETYCNHQHAQSLAQHS